MTRVGLVGCGRWGTNVLRDLRALGCTAFVADSSAKARRSALAKGARRAVATAGELPAVDGIVIATPATSHASIALEMLSREVPIYVEKPLAVSAADRAALAKCASDRVFVMHKWRYHPGVLALAEVARSKVLGPVHGLSTIRVQDGHEHGDVDFVWTLAPHDVSIALEVLGRIPAPRIASVRRTGKKRTPTRFKAVLGTRPFFALEVAMNAPKKIRRLDLFCRDGVAELSGDDDAVVRLFRIRGSRRDQSLWEESRAVSSELPLLRQLRAFVLHLRGGPEPKSSLADGLAVDGTVARLRRMAGLEN